MDHTQGVLDRSNDLTAVAGAAQRTLQAQIATNMGDSRAQRHTFDAATARVVDGATAQILAAPNDARVFIAETRTIAQRLYDSLVPNVSVGDLLAGLFTIDDGPPWLALLKMQPEKGYVQQVHGSADAADRRFEIDETTILTSGVLQKCAFIPPPALRTPGHDLTVLDEQSGGGAHAGPIAAFFLKTFLQCAVPPTPRQQTRSFVRETRAFVDAHPDLGGRAVRDTIAVRDRELRRGTPPCPPGDRSYRSRAMMTRTAALRQFLEAIGRRDGFIPPAADAMRETYDMYRLDAALTPAQLGALTAAHCLALHEVFGAALELRVTGQFGSIAIRGDRLLTTPDGSADPEGIVLTAATGSAANAAIAAALAEMADDDAALDLALDKGLLAADLARERGWVNQAHVVYYFSLDALVALIDAEGLPTLDRLFFAAEARPTVVVVGEGNTLLYRGDLLAITAEARLSNLGSLEHLIRLSPDAMLLEKYRHAGRDHLALNAPLRHLTPAHLICTPEEGGIGALTGALRRGLFHLAVLYTANRATQSESASFTT